MEFYFFFNRTSSGIKTLEAPDLPTLPNPAPMKHKSVVVNASLAFGRKAIGMWRLRKFTVNSHSHPTPLKPVRYSIDLCELSALIFNAPALK